MLYNDHKQLETNSRGFHTQTVVYSSSLGLSRWGFNSELNEVVTSGVTYEPLLAEGGHGKTTGQVCI